MAAMLAGVEAGYGLELDVQMSADGEAMVFHDHTLDRLTERTGPVDALDAAALGGLALAGTDETIPTLAAVLEAVAGRASVLVEVKDRSLRYEPTDGRLEDRVAEVAAAHPDVAVMSFNPHSVARMHEAAPALPRGLTAYDFRHPSEDHLTEARRTALAGMADFDAVGASFVSYGAHCLSGAAPLRSRGVPVYCWTVRSAAQAEAVAPLCDQITFEGFSPP